MTTNLCHISIRVEVYKAQSGLTQFYSRQSSAMCGLTADNLHVVWGRPPAQGMPGKWRGNIYTGML
jgi:hypothetical protein